MVKVTLQTGNCDAANHYKLDDSSDSELRLRLAFDRIVSIQSQKRVRDSLCSVIREQLLRFEWICAGPVNLELRWYLHGIKRQETDKVGDIDNITKPIIDALTGERGLLVDDSQIKSLYTCWNSRNVLISEDLLEISLRFNNEECLRKEFLVFVQYAGPVCIPLNVDFGDIDSMLQALHLIHFRLLLRRTSGMLEGQGYEVAQMLVVSSWDVHRTRLAGFSNSKIYRLSEFRAKCHENGLTWRRLLGLMREKATKRM